MFHFPAFPPHTLCVQVWVTAHDDCRVSPFGNPRIKAWLTAPRGLSWPPTSFIGSWCQGIHRAPLKTWPQMLASTVQFSNNDQTPTLNTRRRLAWDRHRGNSLTAVPSGPNNVPATNNPSETLSTRRSAVLRRPDRPSVPNSQRSTHEQPTRNIRPSLAMCSLERR